MARQLQRKTALGNRSEADLAFFGAAQNSTEEEAAVWLPIDQLCRGRMQPRAYFDQEKIEGLAKTFKEKGFKGIINVRSISDDAYEIIAGERRWLAAQMAGIQKVACKLDDCSDEEALEFGLFENVLREDLSTLEILEGLLSLLQFRHKLSVNRNESRQWVIDHLYSDGRAAQRIRSGRTSSTTSEAWQNITEPTLEQMNFTIDAVHGWLRLLKIPDEIRQAHLTGKLEQTKALEIAKLKDKNQWQPLLDEVLENGLSKSQIIKRVKDLRISDSEKKRHSKTEKVINHFEAAYKQAKKVKMILDRDKAEKLEQILQEIDVLLQVQTKGT